MIKVLEVTTEAAIIGVQVFFFEFCKIFKDNYFLRHLRVAASVTLLPTLIEVIFFSDTILQRHVHLTLVY